MAVTSLWRVKGWLGKVVIYIENPDKTENPAFYEKQNMSEKQTQGHIIKTNSNAKRHQYGRIILLTETISSDL